MILRSFFCLLLSSGAALCATQDSSLTLISRDADGWTFSYSPRQASTAIVTIGGTSYIVLGGPASTENAPGSPQLPVDVFSLGVPPGSSVVAEVLQPLFEIQTNSLVAPSPTYQRGENAEDLAELIPDPNAYTLNEFIPGQLATADAPFTMRDQRIVSIRLHPYQYNAGTKTLRRLTRAILRVRFNPRTNALPMTGRPVVHDPLFENIYKSMIWNYDEAKQWRYAAPEASIRVSDSTGSWFDPAKLYLRVAVANDGWYKVTRQQAQAAGVTPGPDGSVAVLTHGQQVWNTVGPDGSVEFFGRKSTSVYSDTSVYWLTWQGTPGMPFTSVNDAPSAAAPAVVSAQSTRHFEQNTDYYEGTGEFEVTQTEDVPGEGWVWEYIYPQTSASHNFEIDALDPAATTAFLKVRLYSTTVHFATPDHRAQMWVNDSLAGEIDFDGRKEGVFSATIPRTWLKEGSNVLRIASLATAAPVNLFYLDWFEVTYTRLLQASGNALRFAAAGAPGGNPVRFVAHGFTNPHVRLFDVGRGRELLNAVVSGDSATGFDVSFSDSSTSSSEFLLVAEGGETAPADIRRKHFADIRNNPTGADYLVVTHNNFLQAARRLADHRRSFNGIRTALLDVQDLYDEFNFGDLSPWAIKSFLRYAAVSWPKPAPSSLVLFGDASWDYHNYMASSTQRNFVPAYGVPAGDNWYGCLNPDSSLIPSLNIGRLPVEDALQADNVVTKLLRYDLDPPAEWNKNFLCISGGVTPSEQASLNSITEGTINAYLLPAPVGGSVFRVYKSTPAVIDGEHTQYMRDVVKMGVSLINFLGHSGGRTWGVDIGSPYDMENTGGALPFVASVSCNVGAFAEPSGNVLSEDFLLADNRGAIAVWASSSLGYANTGANLVNYFLRALTQDSLRGLGELTTIARFRLWQGGSSSYIVRAHMSLTPLIGDPLCNFALARKPDLAVTATDIQLGRPSADVTDSTVTVRVNVHNFGLVTDDSVEVSVTDSHEGQVVPLLTDHRIARLYHGDSVMVPWSVSQLPGRHTITATLDPRGRIQEVTKANNSGVAEEYVYGDPLVIVRPMPDEVLPSGRVSLMVSAGGAKKNPGMKYAFELDSAATFDSPLLQSSGEIVPGVVSAVWQTPPLPPGIAWFWRARTLNGSITGRWIASSFLTDSQVPNSPVKRIHQRSRKQFEVASRSATVATDSGVTVSPIPPLHIFSKSMGYRGGLANHKYSQLGVNDQVIWGYEWVVGVSFILMRVEKNTGSYDFQAFDLLAHPTYADSMAKFITNTPDGYYVAIAVVYDGRSNVSENLKIAVESLGATSFRSIVSGQSWAFLALKGDPSTAKESLTDDSAYVSLQASSYFRVGTGSVSGLKLPAGTFWNSFHLRGNIHHGTSGIDIAVIGTSSDGTRDTLMVLSGDSLDADLSTLNAEVRKKVLKSVHFAALLSTSDALTTPVLREWWVDCVPPPEPALSAWTVGPAPASVRKGDMVSLPVTVYNLGYRELDSSRIVLGAYDRRNAVIPLATVRVDSIPVDGSRRAVISFPSIRLSHQVTLQCKVVTQGTDDFVEEDNVGLFDLMVETPKSTDISLYADGTQLMDGDYVAPTPRIQVRAAMVDSLPAVERRVELFVDNISVERRVAQRLAKGAGIAMIEDEEPPFFPSLSRGQHDLRVTVTQVNALGEVDSLDRKIVVNVEQEVRLLNVFNYPNPFPRETDFTFVVAGARPPDAVTVRVFTVAGRKIRQISADPGSMRIGFNRIHWDGRDNDGDEIANGYYFYQIAVEAEGKTTTVIGKLARIQ